MSADLIPSAMSPHDAVASMSTQAGAGTVVARGDCTIAGGKAAFFESTISVALMPGITNLGAGYTIVIAHGGKLAYLVVLLPRDNGARAVPAVKSILGSWQWDQA
jgi:hypothetical protein